MRDYHRRRLYLNALLSMMTRLDLVGEYKCTLYNGKVTWQIGNFMYTDYLERWCKE